jgi:hypothetical protein
MTPLVKMLKILEVVKRISGNFRPILNECSFAPFPHATFNCFKVPLLSHIFDLVELKTLDSDI